MGTGKGGRILKEDVLRYQGVIKEESGKSETPIQNQTVNSTAAPLPEAKSSVIVSNEVGMGIVPESPLGRVFRDIAGRAHQSVAYAADEVYFATLGMMLRLRPAPVECVTV